MDETSASESADDASAIVFDRGIDYAIGGILAAVGLLVGLAGVVMTTALSRELVADAIRSGEFQSDVLTEAEAIELFSALVNWGAIGLVAVGVLFIAIGVAVVVYHGRARERGERTPRWILGVVGAMVGSLLSMVPLSPMLGGAAAGYLEPDDAESGLVNGVLAGLFAILPLVLWLAVTTVGLITALPGELAAFAAFFGVIIFVFSLVYFVGLSALGGFIGARLR